QGSGKTTTASKIANRLKQRGRKKVLLASLDVQRPAAQEQLAVLGRQIGVISLPIVSGERPVAITRRALQTGRAEGYDVVLLDTAGRLHVNEELMLEVAAVREAATPHQTLLVADAMTGQDAVNVAKAFAERAGLTGIVLTRVDGDARGGAALSMRAITGKPIVLLGTGEKIDALEPFHPDRIAGRILGMGDILSLVEKAQEKLDAKKSEEFAKKALSGDGFSLEDFREQLRQIKKLGSLQSIVKMLPSIGPFAGIQGMADKVDDKELNRVEAIINSMTAYERDHHEAINGSRRKRIARGSGTSVQEVNQLLRQYAMMKKQFKSLGKGGGFPRKLAGMRFR